jgi:hypothetical protein
MMNHNRIQTNFNHHHRLNSPSWALAFLRSFFQLKCPAIATSNFVTSLFQGGVVSPTPFYQITWRNIQMKSGLKSGNVR